MADYLDDRVKNTEDELAVYDPRLNTIWIERSTSSA